jgi:hypothetical protein
MAVFAGYCDAGEQSQLPREELRGIQIAELFEKHGDSDDFIAKIQRTRYKRHFRHWRHPRR